MPPSTFRAGPDPTSQRAYGLRDARPDDAPALTAFMRASFIEANGHCSSRANVDAFLASTYTETRQREEIEDASIATVLATSAEGAIVGYLQMALRSSPPEAVCAAGPAAQLLRLYVDARYHGSDLGKTLMREAKRRALEAGAVTMWLNAWQEARRALCFYAKHGFRIVGVASFVVGDDQKPNWTLACVLADQ